MSSSTVKRPRKRSQGPAPPHPQEQTSTITQTNDDLNLSVLRRYWPDISTIIHVTPYAVLYLFSPVQQTWEKVGVEGSLFVVLHIAPVQSQDERFSVVMLNRRGLDNFAAPLVTPDDLDVTEQYVIIKENNDIYGIWIFSEPPPSSTAAARETTAHIMLECAKRAQASRDALLHNAAAQHRVEELQDGTGEEDGAGGAAMARTMSLRDIVDVQRTQDGSFSLHQHHSSAISQSLQPTTHADAAPPPTKQSMFAKNPDTEFFHSSAPTQKAPPKKPSRAQHTSPPTASKTGSGGMAISLDDLFGHAVRQG